MSIAIVLATLAAYAWATPPRLSPDGRFYLNAGAGLAVPSPYSRRWFLPFMLGEVEWQWRLLTRVALIVIAVMVGARWGTPGVLVFVGLGGLCYIHALHPVLVDAVAFALALAAAEVRRIDPDPVRREALAVMLACLAGATKETAPAFAAIWAWDPWLLLGTLAASWRSAPAASGVPWLGSPRTIIPHVRASRDWLDIRTMLLPWGALIVLFPLGCREDLPTLQAFVALALGYGQMIVAMDGARLYQWAAPSVMVVALRDPPAWWPGLLALHVFNPYRGF